MKTDTEQSRPDTPTPLPGPASFLDACLLHSAELASGGGGANVFLSYLGFSGDMECRDRYRPN